MQAADGHVRPPGWVLTAGVLVLFAIWSTSFISIEYLLDHPMPGDERLDGPFSWLGLTTARFAPVAVICAVWCFGFRLRESVGVLREHWRRCLLCGCFNVLGYNFALYYAQQQGVAAPVASMITVMAPLFLMIWSAGFLGERLTLRRVAGFVVALCGVVVISLSKEMSGAAYPLLIAVGVCAPLSWSLFTALTKPVMRTVNPVLWTYLTLVIGGIPCLLVLPFEGWAGYGVIAENASAGPGFNLGWAQWGALAHLSLGATVFGFALWTWLLRHLPATVVGFTVFLNPPMTTGFKALLAALWPAAFVFTITTGEYVGGAVVLVGVGIATMRFKPRGS